MFWLLGALSPSAPIYQEKWLLMLKFWKLIPLWLFLVKFDVSNQVFYIDRFKWKYNYLLLGPLVVAGSVLWNRVCPSILLSFHPSVLLAKDFLGIVSLVFSKFWHDTRNLMKLCMTELDFPWKTFCPKIGKLYQRWAKNRVFSIYWKICSLIFTEFVL